MIIIFHSRKGDDFINRMTGKDLKDFINNKIKNDFVIENFNMQTIFNQIYIEHNNCNHTIPDKIIINFVINIKKGAGG